MPYRKFAFAIGEHYHIYNRGTNYGDVYLHREDCLLFLRLLRKHLVEKETLELYAYCLMPNHFHLLVHLLTDRLSSSMQAMMLAYTKTINHKYGRVGPLFQGRFKAVHVADDAYLGLLMKYIHWNPVEAGLVRAPEVWEFSSCRDYLGLRNGTLVPKWRLGRGPRVPYGPEACDLSEAQKARIGALTIDGGDRP
ncbi:MAG TPA: transposase [Anaerolineales bacterium]|nr:transposase [Anaerolineales bacterium]